LKALPWELFDFVAKPDASMTGGLEQIARGIIRKN